MIDKKLKPGIWISEEGYVLAIDEEGGYIAVELGVAGFRDLASKLQRTAALIEKGKKRIQLEKVEIDA